MFFDIFYDLCKKKGVSCKRAAEDIGLSNSITTKWKKTGATPTGETLDRISKYFCVSTDYLLGKETEKAPAGDGKRSVSDAKAAFFEGYGDDLSEEEKDELWEDARVYAKFKAQQKK